MISVEDLKTYPGMTRWFNPGLLARLLLQVIVSKLFGQYADRRLVIAALDNVDIKELRQRADLGAIVKPDAEGAIWIDYVSDLGDGFDSTYAMAYLLAQESLVVGTATLPRGSLLVMGGDEVYPTSSRDDYDTRLRAPYDLAFPNRKDDPDHPPVYMIPGNHDWYDGLVSFLALFCRKKQTSVGNWRTPQRRSYFALELTPGWWLWAIDIALLEDMDQPQADYFVAMAAEMPQRAKLILCSAEPGWYEADSKAAAFRSLDYAAKLADNAGRDFRIVAALSGDKHHYARYASGFGTQFVTSGGGGAFLHGTQSLKDTITLDWLKSKDAELTLKKCYPSIAQSHRLLRGNLRFPLLNWDFSLLLGVFYWALALKLTASWDAETGIVVFLILAVGFGAYSRYQERGKIAAASLEPDDEPDPVKRNVEKGKAWISVLSPPVIQAAAHFVALFALAWLFVTLDARLFGMQPGDWGWSVLLAIGMIPFGGAAAGFIFGVNLWITARFFDMNHNDAFSAMRRDSHRQFLRLRIKGDELTIFPVGLDRVPKRHEWRLNPEAGQGPVGSRFLPPPDVRPHLIEAPVVIRTGTVAAVTAVTDTDSLTGAAPGPAVAPSESPAASAMPATPAAPATPT